MCNRFFGISFLIQNEELIKIIMTSVKINIVYLFIYIIYRMIEIYGLFTNKYNKLL